MQGFSLVSIRDLHVPSAKAKIAIVPPGCITKSTVDDRADQMVAGYLNILLLFALITST